MRLLRELRARIHAYDDIADVSSIARRYFAMNAFDGVVTIIGVLSGAMAAEIVSESAVLVTGTATAFAMGTSGFIGAYLTETAERTRSLRSLERQTLTDLDGTRVQRAGRFAVAVVTVVDGLSPVVAAMVVLLPFWFSSWMPSIVWAYRASLAVALFTLFGLGWFLGRISRGRAVVYAIKTTIAGVVAIAAGLLLGLE